MGRAILFSPSLRAGPSGTTESSGLDALLKARFDKRWLPWCAPEGSILWGG